MYSIARDSLFNPRNLIKYHKKNGFYVFLYFLVLVLVMSISGIVFFASYSNSLMTEASTGCKVTNNVLVCDGPNYNPSTKYDIYNFDVYLLNSSDSVSNISDLSSNAIVLQNGNMSIYVNGNHYTSVSFASLSNTQLDFAKVVSLVRTILMIAGLTIVFVQNVGILLFVILISSLTFLRLRKFIQYRKIIKMVVFAVTPVAILMTIYDLLQFSNLIFIILLFIAYRSVFTLQKELYMQTMIKVSQQQTESGSRGGMEQGEDIDIINDDEEEDDNTGNNFFDNDDDNDDDDDDEN